MERGEGEVKDRGRAIMKRRRRRKGVRKEEGGRDQLLPDGFPTKQVRLHINCT